RGVEGPVDVDLHGEAPARHGVLERRPRRRDGRIVDDQVAAAPFAVDALGEGPDGGRRLVDGAGQARADLARRARGADDVVSLPGQVDAQAPADAAAGAGD